MCVLLTRNTHQINNRTQLSALASGCPAEEYVIILACKYETNATRGASPQALTHEVWTASMRRRHALFEPVLQQHGFLGQVEKFASRVYPGDLPQGGTHPEPRHVTATSLGAHYGLLDPVLQPRSVPSTAYRTQCFFVW